MILTAEFRPAALTVQIVPGAVGMDVGVPVIKEYVDAPAFEGPYEIQPTGSDQVFETTGKRFTSDLTVEAIDPEYIGPDVPRQSNLDVDGLTVSNRAGYYADVGSVMVVPALQDKSATPSETVQTVSFGSGYDGLSSVTISAISSDYVGSAVTRPAALSVSGNTVTAPAGFYDGELSASVEDAVWKAAYSASVTPNVTINTNNGLIKATVSNSHMITPIESAGWALSSTHYTVNISGTDTLQLSTVAATTITPTESVQTAVGSRKYTVGTVKVAAIPADYVGSGVPVQSYLIPLGKTVTGQPGYYPSTTSATVESAVFKSTAQISVTPAVTVGTDGVVSVTVSTSGDMNPIRISGWAESTDTAPYSISGSASVQITDPNLISSNLRAGVTLFGTTGSIQVPTVSQSGSVVTFSFS